MVLLFGLFSSAFGDDGSNVSLIWSDSKGRWCSHYQSREVCVPSGLEIVSVTDGITRMSVPLSSSAPFLILYVYSSTQETVDLQNEYRDEFGDDYISMDEQGVEIRIYRGIGLYNGVVPIGPNLAYLVAANTLDKVDAVASDLASQWSQHAETPREYPDSSALPCDQYFHAGCKEN